MYDDDDSETGGNKLRKKVGGGVRKVARGTRRMSLMAADNIKTNAKKVTTAANEKVKEMNKKKKKKKKKKEKKEKKKKRGRSESPKRSNNSSKPPVTKSGGGLRSLFSPKRWRSASPAVGRKKKNRGSDDEDSEAVAPLPTFSPMDPAVAPPDPSMAYMGGDAAMMAMNGGAPAGGFSAGNGAGMNAYSNHKTNDAIGMSARSMSSAQKFQRNQEQQKIERDNQVPVVSLLLQSNHFLKYCDIAFDLVDTNKDDTVDETELYAGLLLIHLKLGSFLGPAACKPLGRDRCNAMFYKFDTTGSGGLDREEFRRVMMVLFGNVFARVVVQYTLTILIVPLIAKNVVEFLTWDMQGFWDYWTKPKRLRRMGEEFTLADFVDWDASSYPSSRRTFFTKMYRFVRIGSDGFWETFPLTFMTVILGLVIAPVVLHYCDDFFQLAVEWRDNRNKSTNKRR